MSEGVLCLVCSMLPVSVDYPILIVPSVFSNVYLCNITDKNAWIMSESCGNVIFCLLKYKTYIKLSLVGSNGESRVFLPATGNAFPIEIHNKILLQKSLTFWQFNVFIFILTSISRILWIFVYIFSISWLSFFSIGQFPKIVVS